MGSSRVTTKGSQEMASRVCKILEFRPHKMSRGLTEGAVEGGGGVEGWTEVEGSTEGPVEGSTEVEGSTDGTAVGQELQVTGQSI